ncbi:hypothetical protein [uncultured Gemmiger sp.]|uniref:hypothetical protein n=1 Tax=uncultured Gemmiger sp. TaxID=1623490 RepID=UPI0025E9C9B2|nr:hypothetical protein [uncultured Gemmiger sp.]
MTWTLKIVGILLLAGCGAAAGFLLASRARESWRSVHAFGRLMEYLQSAIQYQALTGEQLLARAANYPEFARLGAGQGLRLGELMPPAALDEALRQELSADLTTLESAPRDKACTLLTHMAALCHSQEADLRAAANTAARLYPRLGGCAGILVALFLL